MAEQKNMYELTYIVNAVLNEEQIKAVVERVAKLITDGKGTILTTNEWGSRRLAYPIRKKRNGYYVNLFFESPGASIVKMERSLEIDDDILRYMTLRLDAKMIRKYEKDKAGMASTPAEAADAESDS